MNQNSAFSEYYLLIRPKDLVENKVEDLRKPQRTT